MLSSPVKLFAVACIVLLLHGCISQQPVLEAATTPTPEPEKPTAATPTPTPVPELPQPAFVSVSEDGFNPAIVYLKNGEAIMWVNEGVEEHSLIFLDVQSPPLPAGGRGFYKRAFDESGNYSYVDGKNPNIKGTVVVVD